MRHESMRRWTLRVYDHRGDQILCPVLWAVVGVRSVPEWLELTYSADPAQLERVRADLFETFVRTRVLEFFFLDQNGNVYATQRVALRGAPVVDLPFDLDKCSLDNSYPRFAVQVRAYMPFEAAKCS